MAARDSLKEFLRERLNLTKGALGMISVIHSFGEYLGYHPHLHVLCADGLFNAMGLFYCMRPCELNDLEKRFQAKVLKLFMIDIRSITASK